FALSELSPCIDAGTLDLPEGIELPEYDLAGNPRIVGGAIDMGAYEFQGTNFNEELIINNERINLSIYPNPFKPNERGHNSSIKFNLLESCNVDLTIYNMKGQKVKTMMDAYASRGEYNCRWNGSDDNGKPVSSGQYVLKLVVDDETKAVRKMIVFR
ncbi:MAG: T9SS type A sorting domain-containing protein, partial [Candidatus Cloacimonetes bacterium]|nr:T9SS type A sorting domain-containing protein [Candidatus Cloacimonadota bacterium]